MQPTTSFGSFIVAALTATLAAGSVIPSARSAGSFEVKREENPNFGGRNGPLALAKAYKKYGVPVPESLIQAAENVKAAQLSKRATGTAVANSDSGDLEYLVNVQIGTPAQTLRLDFDTGSSDLWVFSTETDGDVSGHKLYDPKKSSSSKKLAGASWEISYGDGSSSSGDVYTDAVTVGGLTFKNQAVESAKKASDEFIQGNNDGLLGLAFSSINTVEPKQQKTFFDNITPSLDAPLFVADLRHNSPGSYIFGAIPSAAKNVLYSKVNSSQGFWQFTTSSGGSSFSAIADTGTTLLLLSTSQTKAYYKQVKGATLDQQQGGYVFDCSTKLPDYTFTVGSGKITVPGSLINYAEADGGKCFGGIQDAGQIPFTIFGDVALKAAYVVFDGGKNQVGWAQKN
ncbi:Endothiapepsin [Cladobotryum mycophilum]|uniref:Endothiapepsin n=1 Tax=Cladobotryum mycophilum TaxID=491253 RepID=A0ABR0SC76_9HYPO